MKYRMIDHRGSSAPEVNVLPAADILCAEGYSLIYIREELSWHKSPTMLTDTVR